MGQNDGTLMMEDAQLIFRNFQGKEGKYNREGDRNFCVLLNPEIAEQMARDNWNIKVLNGREGEDDQPYIQVSVGYKIRPPKVFMITTKGRTPLGEDEIELLDWVDIKTVDLIIRPYEWTVSGKSGIKAYLQTMYLTVEEDALDLKYADVEELPSSSGRVRELPAGHDGEVIEGTWR